MKRFLARQRGDNPLVGAAVVGALIGVTIGVVTSSGESVPEMIMSIPKGVVKTQEEIVQEETTEAEAQRIERAIARAKERGEDASAVVAQLQKMGRDTQAGQAPVQPLCTPGQRVFDFAERKQEFVFPTNCSRLTIKMWGAGGGGSGNPNSSSRHFGGGGGFASAQLKARDGDVFYVYVGGGGQTDATAYDFVQGGKKGDLPLISGGSGGGSSAITLGTRPVLVAAGGGGASFYFSGGAAGGPVGSNGQGNYAAGKGGSQRAPGEGGYGHIYSVGEDADTVLGAELKEKAKEDGLLAVKTEEIDVTDEDGTTRTASAIKTKTNGQKGRGPSGGHAFKGETTTLTGGWGWSMGGNGGSCELYQLHGPGGGGAGYNGGGGGACDHEKQAGGGGGGSSYADQTLSQIQVRSASGSQPGNGLDIDRGIAGQGGSNITNGRDGRVVVYWD